MNRQMQMQQIQQMMGNPQFRQQFIQRMRNINPAQVLDKIANDPQAMQIEMVANAINLRNSNDTDGLYGMAENVFREKGKDYREFEKQAKESLGFS